MKLLEISGSADEFASDRDAVLLVTDEFGRTEQLGVRRCVLPNVRKLSASMNLGVQIPTVAALCASCRVDSYPDNGHVRRGIYDNSCRVAPWL